MKSPYDVFRFDEDPFKNFENIYGEVEKTIKKDPNAISLATASPDGVPSVRTVLFKGLVRKGFSFYTNYQSQKSQELTQNPRASILFFWSELEHQIRIDGSVEKLTREESENYYRSRPRLSQIGAWASEQSKKMSSLKQFEEAVAFYEKKFSDQEIPLPEHWGGYRLIPQKFEFWFGRHGRLHERYVYELIQSNWDRYLKFP